MTMREWGFALLTATAALSVGCDKKYQFTDVRAGQPVLAKPQAAAPPPAAPQPAAPTVKPAEPEVAPAPVIVQQVVVMKPNPFQGMTTQEVIRKKYKTALLSCQLRLQEGTKLDEIAPPQDAVVWDLIENAEPKKTFHMLGRAKNHELDFDLTIESLEITGFIHYADTRGTVYQMESSLTVRLHFSSKEKIEYDDGVQSLATSSGSQDAHERIVATLVSNDAAMEGTVSRFQTDVRCLLHTEINPDYKDQFDVMTEKTAGAKQGRD